MYNISSDASFIAAPLREDKEERGPQKGRLVLVESQNTKDIVWLTPQEQKMARKKGASISDNLEKIAQAVPYVIANRGLRSDQAPILLKNISWIDRRIESHNQKLASSKIRSFFSKIFPGNRPYNRLDIPTLIEQTRQQGVNRSDLFVLLGSCSPEDRKRFLEQAQSSGLESLCSWSLTEKPSDSLTLELLLALTPQDRADLLKAQTSDLYWLTPDQAVKLTNQMTANGETKAARQLFNHFSQDARAAITASVNQAIVQGKNPPSGRPVPSQRLSLNPAAASYSTSNAAGTPKSPAEVYAGRSFLRQTGLDFSQKGTSLSDKQWETLSQLIEGYHKETLNELQQHKEFRVTVQKRLSHNPPDALKHLIPALKAFENHPSSFQLQGGFLKTLLFIEKNKELIKEWGKEQAKTGQVGAQIFLEGHIVSASKRYAHLGLFKIKSNNPNDPSQTIIFDPKTGEVKYINFHEKIGSGGFKDKVKRIFSDNNQLLAVSRQTRDLDSAQKELDIAKQLKNNKKIDTRNMILPTGHQYRNQNNVEVMMTETPFCEGGDLFDFVTKGKFSLLNLSDRLAIMGDIMRATLNVHKAGIIHRDIKLENVLLTHEPDPKTGRIRLTAKMADFGLARAETSPNTPGGTLEYIAPETWSDQIQDKKSDIWAIGVVLSLCQTSKFPYHAASKQAGDIWQASLRLQADTCSVKELENLFTTLKTAKDKQKELKKLPNLVKLATPEAIQKAVTWGLTRPNPAERWDLEFALAIVESLEKTV